MTELNSEKIKFQWMTNNQRREPPAERVISLKSIIFSFIYWDYHWFLDYFFKNNRFVQVVKAKSRIRKVYLNKKKY